MHINKTFSIILPKVNACVKSYNVGATKWMYFLTEYEELFKNIKIFGIKPAILYKKEFDSTSIYNKNFPKTNIKSYSNESTDFPDKKIP